MKPTSNWTTQHCTMSYTLCYMRPTPAYVHVGIALHLDNSHSPFLKTSAKLADLHKTLTSIYILWMGIVAQTNHSLVQDLLTTKRLVRTQLASIPFPTLYVDFLSRNVALVNKSSGLLHDDLQIPPHWWTTFLTSKNSTR